MAEYHIRSLSMQGDHIRGGDPASKGTGRNRGAALTKCREEQNDTIQFVLLLKYTSKAF